MRPTALMAILLLLAGAGTLVWLNASGGTASSGVTIPQILSGDAGKGRLRLAVQLVEFHNEFNPVEFTAIDVVEEGVTPSLDAPKIRVRYSGNDKITLEPYSHVAIEGSWDAQHELFVATSMSTRCPSHYEDKGQPLKPASDGSASMDATQEPTP